MNIMYVKNNSSIRKLKNYGFQSVKHYSISKACHAGSSNDFITDTVVYCCFGQGQISAN